MKISLHNFFLVILTAFLGCGDKKREATKPSKDKSILFVIEEKGTKINDKHSLFYKLKTNKDFNKKNSNFETEIFELGNLNMISGQLTLCDIREHKDPPNKYYPDSNPFVIKLKPGKYNVNAVIANTIDDGDRTALIKLEITDKRAAKWILAHKTNHNPYNLQKGEFYGTNTEAATLTLFDRESGIYFNKKKSKYLTKDKDRKEYEFFESLFEYSKYDLKNYTKSSCININLENEFNLVQFCTGYGDGSYPAYWGIDKDNYICSLIIDFGIF